MESVLKAFTGPEIALVLFNGLLLIVAYFLKKSYEETRAMVSKNSEAIQCLEKSLARVELDVADRFSDARQEVADKLEENREILSTHSVALGEMKKSLEFIREAVRRIEKNGGSAP